MEYQSILNLIFFLFLTIIILFIMKGWTLLFLVISFTLHRYRKYKINQEYVECIYLIHFYLKISYFIIFSLLDVHRWFNHQHLFMLYLLEFFYIFYWMHQLIFYQLLQCRWWFNLKSMLKQSINLKFITTF